jgi:GNAT superfamily N-acetyltransferase
MIAIARTEQEIEDCYDVMAELRPHLSFAEFLPRVRRQAENHGFRLVYRRAENEIKAVGGFRIAEWLAGGRYLEIEDLVAREGERSKGYGREIFDFLVALARAEKCEQVRLVSHVARFGAHRFYLRRGMNIEAHYFSMKL